MNIAVTGATGFIGNNLSRALASEHNVLALTRSPQKASAIFEKPINITRWNPNNLDGWEKSLIPADAIVNLTGTNLASGRWTEKMKNKITQSRINSYQILLQTLKKFPTKPHTFIIASAIGYYGSRDDELLSEDSQPGSGFLAELCQQIENLAPQFEALNIRTVILRTGLVIDPSGGALPQMALPFKLYLGGYWGSGNQWLSWISLADEIAAIKFLLENPDLKGPFNLTSPQPIRNRDFCKILAHTLHKPCCLPVPASFLKLTFGQMARELFLTSQKVYPQKLLDAGFNFKNYHLETTLTSMNFWRNQT